MKPLKKIEIKNADTWAKIFKLHNCIGNKKFAAQVKAIQENAIESLTQKQSFGNFHKRD